MSRPIVKTPLLLVAATALALPTALSTALSTALPASAATTGPRAAAEKPDTSTVYVIQGVAQATVAVKVDGKTVSGAMPAQAISKPLRLSSGSHSATFRADDWTVRTTFEVSAPSLDLVLHWPADKQAKPQAEVFVNDLRPVATDHGRLSVAHTAVVPPADIRVDKKVVFANIANGEFVTSTVPAGTYSVDIVPTGQGGTPLFGPVDLPVKPELLTRVFAIGQPKQGGMQAVVQTLPLARTGSPAPDLVNAGSAGLMSPQAMAARALATPVSPVGATSPSPLGSAAVLLAFVVGAYVVRGRRRTTPAP